MPSPTLVIIVSGETGTRGQGWGFEWLGPEELGGKGGVKGDGAQPYPCVKDKQETAVLRCVVCH